MREQLRSDEGSAPNEPEVTIELRVPGPWVSPDQLASALVDRKTGYDLGDGELIDTLTNERFEIAVTEHDDDLGPLFRGGHQGRMSEEELLAVGAHAVKVHVIGPGGSEQRAKRIVDATAALRELAHAAQDPWLHVAQRLPDPRRLCHGRRPPGRTHS